MRPQFQCMITLSLGFFATIPRMDIQTNYIVLEISCSNWAYLNSVNKNKRIKKYSQEQTWKHIMIRKIVSNKKTSLKNSPNSYALLWSTYMIVWYTLGQNQWPIEPKDQSRLLQEALLSWGGRPSFAATRQTNKDQNHPPNSKIKEWIVQVPNTILLYKDFMKIKEKNKK